MIYTSPEMCPVPSYPTYPPYHKGLYLEDYFHDRYSKDNFSTDRNYIGISWTTLYIEGKYGLIQNFLDSLPKDKKYFTVSQHDDAPAHNLPADTYCFSAGGNARGKNIIPIPLICSPLNIESNEKNERNILASFIGSNTHRIRQKLAETLKESKNIKIFMKGWSPSVKQEDFSVFCDITLKSKFCICPRGYGLNSFRLYEAMQLGAIPVIVTDEPYLPWTDELDWNEFSVIVPETSIQFLEEILISFSDEKIKEMQEKIRNIYPIYFSMEGLYKNILKRLNYA